MSTKEEVYVALIAYRHGDFFLAARSREAVIDKIHDYVLEEWDGHDFDSRPPSDKQQAINEYFEHSGDSLIMDSCELD